MADSHGFSARKRAILELFHPELTLQRATADDPTFVWGRPADDPRASSTVWVEDGFLRSVGLGADLVAPLSWVFDRSGLYFDATGPSDLETILATKTFSSDEIQRASELRRQVVSAGLSKYNVGATPPELPSNRLLVLVPGQVESDASLALGSPILRRNAELLAAARAERPDAFIIYKPHPDVVAGLRAQGSSPIGADLVLPDADIAALLPLVDEVHVMTSLAGFEALLRGRRVVCHGLPFYAGWGLTDDRVHCTRRTRHRTLDELVVAALIDYPRYLDPRSAVPITPERAVDILADLRRTTRPAFPVWAAIRRFFLRRP